jgi:glyoxylase I family protein
MVTGIEHIAIASPDPHRLADWYVEHLDFTINYRSANSKTVFVKAAGGAMLEIIESSGAARAPLDMKGPGLRHLQSRSPTLTRCTNG